MPDLTDVELMLLSDAAYMRDTAKELAIAFKEALEGCEGHDRAEELYKMLYSLRVQALLPPEKRK